MQPLSRIFCLNIALLAFGMACAGPGKTARPDGLYSQMPSMKGFHEIQTLSVDWNDDGYRESAVATYRKSRGDTMEEYRSHGKTWGWKIMRGDDPADCQAYYYLTDENGDGYLDSFGCGESGPVMPPWVFDYWI